MEHLQILNISGYNGYSACLAVVADESVKWSLNNNIFLSKLFIGEFKVASLFFNRGGKFYIFYHVVDSIGIFVDGEKLSPSEQSYELPNNLFIEIEENIIRVTTNGLLANFLCGCDTDIETLIENRDSYPAIDQALKVWKNIDCVPDNLSPVARAVYDRIVELNGYPS